ncbi:MAG: hypothetical protein JXR96_08160 [Deltaproteobacteria bacterium]|nr:hypothetical protein [Deltaproteobacteria bacterium]
MRKRLLHVAGPCVLFSCFACVYGDLDIGSRACNDRHPCPSGTVCVQRPTGPSDTHSECAAEQDAFSCTPGECLCGTDGTRSWIERCLGDGHSTEFETRCEGDSRCNPDLIVCSPPCDAESDCQPDQTCDLGLGLCRPYPTCETEPCEGICVEDACVQAPDADPEAYPDPAETDCLLDAPPAVADQPATCRMSGRVYLYPLNPTNPLQTPGLQIELYDPDALDAQPEQSVRVEAAAWDSGNGHYEFTAVETNRPYTVVILAGTSDRGTTVVSTAHHGVVVRADACLDGEYYQGFGAVTQQDYSLWSEGVGEERCLLVGRIRDCRADKIQLLSNIAAGLAIEPMPPGRLYYFPDGPVLTPDSADPPLAFTSIKGYYAASGLPACRNQVAFLAHIGGSAVALESISFSCRPGWAIVIEPALPAERLPE